jgi:DNA-binding NarL/FixJ family response regulator
VIRRQPDFVPCGEAGTVAEAYKAVETLQPDLVLLDLWLGGGDGLDLIKSLKSQFSSLRILVVSFSDETVYAERSLRAGALGYVMKSQPSSEVVAAIRAILAGQLYVSPTIANLMVGKAVGVNRGKQDKTAELLTDRELQVLQLLGAGQSTRKIADALSLSFKTVETHRDNIKHKLDLQDAPELIRYATVWVQEHRLHLSPRDLLPSPAQQN